MIRKAGGEVGQGITLVLVGFLVLFFELACIRWFAANVIFLQFFTNVVLIASFLGMSCGCLIAARRQDWLAQFPFLAFFTFALAEAMLLLYSLWGRLAVDVGLQRSPQEIFFGTEYRTPDVAHFVVPIELIAAVFFVLVALLFVGLGQVLGRAFNAYPNRVKAYTLNIGGSLAGIVAFSAVSWAQAPPLVWFAVIAAGVAYLLYKDRRLTWLRGMALAALLALVCVPVFSLTSHTGETYWSPYYAISYDPSDRMLFANTINHQIITPFQSGGAIYSLIHLLQRESGGKPFQDVLIIGAGTGNDMSHALRFGARHLDAVEIDPVIQRLGVRKNPDRPYQDPRVSVYIDDGRHFLRTTDHRYDLVVYGLVDSLILHSSYANIRLESYLFTDEAFQDVRRTLKPDGIFVMYNFFRQGWIVQRVAAMATDTFGHQPIVIAPPKDTLRSEDPIGFTWIIAGDTRSIAGAFRRHPRFWLNGNPVRNLPLHGFTIRPADLSPRQRGQGISVAPATLVHEQDNPMAASDDWPFLYVRGRLIPALTIRSLVILGLLGLAMVYVFLPKEGGGIHGRMFFLGAAFMLLETKAVVQLALLFGSTWIVNSLVFFTVLVLLLLANLYVLKGPRGGVAGPYAGLFLLLAAGVLIPLHLFFGGGLLWRYAAPCALTLGPVLCAGVIFARTFRDTPHPDQAFGSNIAGSVVGGFAESCSLLLGFRYLLLLAMAFYLLSAGVPSLRFARFAGVGALRRE